MTWRLGGLWFEASQGKKSVRLARTELCGDCKKEDHGPGWPQHKSKKSWECDSSSKVVEHLPGQCKALNSTTPRTTEKKKEQQILEK
jgi:hypothetical protein